MNDRNAAIEIARKWIKNDAVIIDTETTGLLWGDEVVEAAVIELSSGKVLLNSLVKPLNLIPQEVINIHHITNEMVADAPSYIEVFPQIIDAIKNRDVLAYNASFDISSLRSALTHFPASELDLNEQLASSYTSVQCAMLLYAQYAGDWNHGFGEYQWHSLINAAKQTCIDLSTLNSVPHRALYDCQLTAAVIHAMANTQLDDIK